MSRDRQWPPSPVVEWLAGLNASRPATRARRDRLAHDIRLRPLYTRLERLGIPAEAWVIMLDAIESCAELAEKAPAIAAARRAVRGTLKAMTTTLDKLLAQMEALREREREAEMPSSPAVETLLVQLRELTWTSAPVETAVDEVMKSRKRSAERLHDFVRALDWTMQRKMPQGIQLRLSHEEIGELAAVALDLPQQLFGEYGSDYMTTAYRESARDARRWARRSAKRREGDSNQKNTSNVPRGKLAMRKANESPSVHHQTAMMRCRHSQTKG